MALGWRGLACAMALTVSWPAWSAPAVVNPDWLKKPNGEDVSDAYPPVAQALSVTGRVLMRCLVDARGAMRNCEIEKEGPVGFGFGHAALSLSHAFVMRPLTVAGISVDGAEVQIPIAFQFPPEEAPAARPTGPEPSAASLALARRAAQTLRIADALRESLGAGLHDLEAVAPDVAPAIQAAAVNAYREVMEATIPAVAEAMARTYAATFTDRQLRDIVASGDSPADVAPYSTPENLALRLFNARADEFDAMFRTALRDRFCKRIACAAGAATPTAPGARP